MNTQYSNTIECSAGLKFVDCKFCKGFDLTTTKRWAHQHCPSGRALGGTIQEKYSLKRKYMVAKWKVQYCKWFWTLTYIKGYLTEEGVSAVHRRLLGIRRLNGTSTTVL